MEMEEVIGNHGWTKEAMGRLWKLDSFMKESSRLAGVSNGKSCTSKSDLLLPDLDFYFNQSLSEEKL
jgi:hypothetical protein